MVLPLPLPPPKAGAGHAEKRQDDRRIHDNTKPAANKDKLVDLRAYRRTKGLCFTCGE